MPRSVASDVIQLAECISSKTYADTLGELAHTATWNLKIPFNLTEEEYLGLACKGKHDAGLKKIIPVIAEMDDVLIYHACPANVYTACKRDAVGVTKPDPTMVTDFLEFYSDVFDREIKPLLEDFDYDYNAWYNTLNTKQQALQDKANLLDLEQRSYKCFCKKEKQQIDDPDKNPKNRCITGPNEEYKYVMGPIVKRLEAIFKKNFKGYCSGKNWTQKEQMMNDRRLKELRLVVEGDGSGFDRTQYVELKEIEFMVYRHLANTGKITHVDPKTFVSQATRAQVKIEAACMTKCGKYCKNESLGYYLKTGTTQSGNADTTFANTLRMCMYNRYICERLMGLSPEQYDLDTAGDDFTIYLPVRIPINDIKTAYYKAFSKAKTGTHGLGQILKFLKISDIEDVDFCSTETFYSKTAQSYKIIRKLPRFFTLTAWSQKALGMSALEQKRYMLDLYHANQEWIGELPILKEYNELLRVFAEKIETDGKPLTNKKFAKKKSKPTNKQHLYDNASLHKFQELEHKLGTDDAYAFVDRVSDKSGTTDDFVDYLARRYGITRDEIAYTQKQLVSMQQAQLGRAYFLPIIRRMCEVKTTHTNSLLELREVIY